MDAGLRIERVSAEAQTLFNRPVDELIGVSFPALLTKDVVITCQTAYAEACTSRRGVTVNLTVSVATAERPSEPLLCEVLLLPLQPSPSCAFVLLPVPVPARHLSDTEAMPEILHRLGRAAGATRTSPSALFGGSGRKVPGLDRLTARELQIVSGLLDGHRPPAIARSLFLSQSTVRNHLASVFTKLGVASQPALLELFRTARSGAHAHGIRFSDQNGEGRDPAT